MKKVFILCGILSCSLSTILGMENMESMVKGIKEAEKEPQRQPNQLRLTRVFSNDVHAQYAGKLYANEENLDLHRATTTQLIQDTHQLSSYDNRIHLLAQGFWMSDEYIQPKVFNTSFGFPDIATTNANHKTIDWASHEADLTKFPNKYHHKQSEASNGHSEPEFIGDIEALFTQNADKVVSAFTSRHEDEDIYACGLELFGQFDMCDYCLKRLREFRQRQQIGQTSISYAIRDKLKQKFKGVKKSNAFVVVYHSHYPYKVSTYKVEDDDENHYQLKYGGIYGQDRYDFIPDEPEDFEENDTLSQHRNLDTEQDIIYGCIHHLHNQGLRYRKNAERFSFA
ncbi:MAG: hypothetical protein KBD04_02945 [Proteobacteria bacterium]|nr:hypothetical protein [Pseudomonadota bacterium]